MAKQLHAILEGEKVASYLKTSGKTGLHIMVSWHQAEGYDTARDWAMGIALRVVADLPDIATVERRKDRQQKKVYVDVLQNARGHHVVPPYVLRVVPQATVSTPLTWAELTPALQPERYNLKTIFQLARQKTDPMVARGSLTRCLRLAGVHLSSAIAARASTRSLCAFSHQTRSANNVYCSIGRGVPLGEYGDCHCS